MKLNQLFAVLPTVITVNSSRKMESSNSAHASKGAAHSSQGAEETVLITKRLRLVGKIPLIEINPVKFDPTDVDSVKRARVLAWLENNPSNPDSPIEKEEMIQVTKMIIKYADDSRIPSIEDTSLIAAKNLLKNASKVSKQIQDLSKFRKISRILTFL